MKRFRSLSTWGSLQAQGMGVATGSRLMKIIPFFENQSVKQIGAGVSHFAVLNDKGHVFVQGSNYFGQAGFFPHLNGGIFESEDDTLSEAIRVQHGLDDVFVKSISVGDFHNLALSDSGKVFSWGAGFLGNGNNLYCSEPKPVKGLENTIQVVASEGASACLMKQGQVFIWGKFRNGAAFTPKLLKLETGFKGDIVKIVSLTNCKIAVLVKFATETYISVHGFPDDNSRLQYPYNPTSLEKEDVLGTDFDRLPLLYQEIVSNPNEYEICRDYLIRLNPRTGIISIKDINNLDSQWNDIFLCGGDHIRAMQVSRNAAIFCSENKIYTFMGKFDTQKDGGFSFFLPSFNFFSRKKDEPKPKNEFIPGVSVIRMILERQPEIIDAQNTRLVCCGLDYFIQEG